MLLVQVHAHTHTEVRGFGKSYMDRRHGNSKLMSLYVGQFALSVDFIPWTCEVIMNKNNFFIHFMDRRYVNNLDNEKWVIWTSIRHVQCACMSKITSWNAPTCVDLTFILVVQQWVHQRAVTHVILDEVNMWIIVQFILVYASIIELKVYSYIWRRYTQMICM